MRRIAVLCTFAACALAFVSTDAAATPEMLVVDDDGAQCADADFPTIEAAVTAAPSGAVIHVCPGLYAEAVVVDKPLTLRGEPDAVEALDCFEPTPSQLGDADPTQQVIVDGSGSSSLALFTLQADDITLAGFVLQGASSVPLPADDHFLRRAIDASDDHSGYRIHHNVLRLNTVGIQLGSSGATHSRFDHNCLRQNGWGLATDYRDLVNARIDHNTTFNTQNFAFEPTKLGNRRENITFDHNVSRQDNTAYFIVGSKGSRIVANTIESARIGMQVGAANENLEIARNVVINPLGGNRFGGALQGIAFTPPAAGQEPTRGALVRENTVTAMRSASGLVGDGIVAAGPPNAPRPALMNSELLDNVTSDNVRDGIVLRGGNAGNTVRGNMAERNGRYGIYAQGAIGNLFEANWMFDNGAFDARDEARESNHWVANQCRTDFPPGTICPTG